MKNWTMIALLLLVFGCGESGPPPKPTPAPTPLAYDTTREGWMKASKEQKKALANLYLEEFSDSTWDPDGTLTEAGIRNKISAYYRSDVGRENPDVTAHKAYTIMAVTELLF